MKLVMKTLMTILIEEEKYRELKENMILKKLVWLKKLKKYAFMKLLSVMKLSITV